MKRIIGILLISILVFSCEDDARKEMMSSTETQKIPDSIQVLQGDYVSVGNEAIFRGDSFIYGVKRDSAAIALAGKVEGLKSDDFEMIPLTLKAKIVMNPAQNGLDELIEVLEIVEIPEANIVSDSIKK